MGLVGRESGGQSKEVARGGGPDENKTNLGGGVAKTWGGKEGM